VLGSVDLVAAEDTRRGRQLLAHFGLEKTLLSLHEHNEDSSGAKLLAELGAGRSVALISDAGTPLISDPGMRLVADARAAGIDVRCVPGPCAAIAALSVSGLPTDRFVFEGFLSRRAGQRRERLETLRTEPRTLVFFEAVHRIEAAIADMVRAFGGDRVATIARELTKRHEQVVTAPLAELAEALNGAIPQRGEFVIVVAGAGASRSVEDDETKRIYGILAAEVEPSVALALCVRITGRPRNEIYSLVHE